MRMVSKVVRYLTLPLWETRRGKGGFVRTIRPNGRVLDVGCGNNSPMWFKNIRPDLLYTGIDIEDYNQASDPRKFANDYVICAPDDFAEVIEGFRGQFDAVVSSHNLEHCNEPDRVLKGMIGALRAGGRLYLSFPCESSVTFPHRVGTLNFFDDPTHKTVPKWTEVVATIRGAGCSIEFAAQRYRPLPLLLRGLFLEPVCAVRRRVAWDGSTWALYGFESVIWAVRKDADNS
jgi:SAM-dependent methyltransferase